MFVYLDAANLELSVKDMRVVLRDIPDDLAGCNARDLCWRVNYQKLYDFFSTHCDLRCMHFFSADLGTDTHHRFIAKLKHIGYRITTKPIKQYSDHTADKPNRKANFDVELSILAVEHKHDFQTLVLFSGDCDFAYLLRYLRGRGNTCVTFSRQGHVAYELPPASNQYFDVIDFRHEFLEVRLKKHQTSK
jgi:uncharacterized LabA/DUF88 family protein